MMVDQAAVLVAGHCIFTHTPALCVDKNACWISDLQIFQKYQTEDEQESGFTQVLTWTAWTKNRDYQYDLAGIKLAQPLGKNAGWLGFGYNNDPQNEFFPTAKFEHTSYPSNPASGIEKWSGYFASVEDHHFYTDGLSNDGTSGAGAHSNDHFQIIYSVLSHHKIGTLTQTAHTRITPDKFFALHDWITGNIKDKNFIFYMPFFTD